ncbi:hypothetical protein PIB30_028552 [Stylosanthes scabra]|uniref:Uncharacterized protein n=1 Tax=Stylosanthes scabra TaxID=79078 RepID=A0ABU6TAQ5_9FABA|nr:hypothetical protein [Stylosanthes scabra]
MRTGSMKSQMKEKKSARSSERKRKRLALLARIGSIRIHFHLSSPSPPRQSSPLPPTLPLRCAFASVSPSLCPSSTSATTISFLLVTH